MILPPHLGERCCEINMTHSLEPDSSSNISRGNGTAGSIAGCLMLVENTSQSPLTKWFAMKVYIYIKVLCTLQNRMDKPKGTFSFSYIRHRQSISTLALLLLIWNLCTHAYHIYNPITRHQIISWAENTIETPFWNPNWKSLTFVFCICLGPHDAYQQILDHN